MKMNKEKQIISIGKVVMWSYWFHYLFFVYETVVDFKEYATTNKCISYLSKILFCLGIRS